MLLSSLLGINFEFDHINLGKISISLSTIDFLLKKFKIQQNINNSETILC